MAYLDYSAGTNFSTAQAITVTAASTNVFDVTGAGAGNAPAMIGANGVNTALGYDIGAGDGQVRPTVLVSIGVNGTGAGTIQIQLQAAPDNGSYSPGSYVTIVQTDAIVGTALDAGQLIEIPVPPVPPAFSGLPRFYRLNYVVAGTAGVTLTANLLLNPPEIRTATIYGSNFQVAS